MEYYLGKGRERLGPFGREQVRKMMAQGQIGPADLVWHEGMDNWERLGEHPHFAGPPPLIPGPRPGTAAPAPVGEELRSLYEAFIGPEKSPYYIPIFERFDAGGSSASWNWPAALFTSWWMLYRGMYLWGLLLYPIVYIAAFFAIMALFSVVASQNAYGLAEFIAIPGSRILLGVFGNRLYHAYVHKYVRRSARLGLDPQQRREWLIRKGATGFFWILFVFIFIAVIGILAAIAIPAYQDYTIRSQVSEGAVLADGVKTAVAEYYLQHNAFPPDNASAGLQAAEAIDGRFVTSVAVHDDRIEVTYGRGANPRVSGQTLVYVATPVGGSIQWHCNTPLTTLPNRYLPMACRR